MLTEMSLYDYPEIASAKSGVGLPSQKYQERLGALLKRFFYARKPFNGGAYGALRSAATLGAVWQPVRPATLSIAINGGSSQSNQEDTIVHNLIPVSSKTFHDQPVQSINAQDLCSFLSISTRFDTWITRRIEEYGFKKGEDYLVEQVHTGGRPKTIYYLTLDMAKELSMVERNDKGRQARRYFIECEKRLKEAAPVTHDYSAQIIQHIDSAATKMVSGIKSACEDHLRVIAMEELARKPAGEALKALTRRSEQVKPVVLFESDVKYLRMSLQMLAEETKKVDALLWQKTANQGGATT